MTAQQWLSRAKGNLARAKQAKPAEAFWEDLCFDAQQAVEKAVKAVLAFHRIDFPKTHDIGELLTLANQSGHQIPEMMWKADDLTDYAVATRYPGPSDPVTEDEYRDAVVLAEQVVRWVERTIAASQE